MWLKWLPWRLIIKRIARAQGFFDPITLISQLNRFAQPAEVAVPVELLRIASVLHARGLINSQAIQHNLDWVWPFWVNQQFDPKKESFIPRAFSLTHINLTHRNWTAIGLPGYEEMPIVDPRGLIMPFYDSWSVDSWIIGPKGELIPSRLESSRQSIDTEDGIEVVTDCEYAGKRLLMKAKVTDSDLPTCLFRVTGSADEESWLVIAARPYNPEGISFIHNLSLDLQNKNILKVNNKNHIHFNTAPEKYVMSNYNNGDAYHKVLSGEPRIKINCEVGMATGCALFRIKPGKDTTTEVKIPLYGKKKEKKSLQTITGDWSSAINKSSEIEVPEASFKYIYDTAKRMIILHSPDDIYPGPYTYKHFWFRDATFITYAMLCCGLSKLAEKAIDRFLSKQSPTGYFSSQNGEWDSNGQVLWVMRKFCELTGEVPRESWRKIIEKGANWIRRKRLSPRGDKPHAGLMPAGFSAEHLGPNDYYYWDDFWSVAGLKSAAYFMHYYNDKKNAGVFEKEADSLMRSIQKSLREVSKKNGRAAIPASPYRRMDSGAIGSLAGGYPLQLLEPDDTNLLDTVEYILEHFTEKGGFFHEISHSGINPYLTLHLAEVLLRAGDKRFLDLLRSVRDLSSPTGQWPEAIHPRTLGGCMGDGQHTWASAEWMIMTRNLFVREESQKLILCSGIPADWYKENKTISFGPAPTLFGDINITVCREAEEVKVEWKGKWNKEEPYIEIRPLNGESVMAESGKNSKKFKIKE